MQPSDPRAVRDAFDAIAEEFDATRREPWREAVDFLEGLSAGALVLDLGCGNGRHLAVAVRRGHPAVGLDFSQALLDRARGTGPLVAGVLTRLPFRDGCAGAVLLVAAIHHLAAADRREALAEVRRVLTAGGRVLASAWARDQPRFAQLAKPSDGEVLVPWKTRDGAAVERFYHLYADEELRTEVAAAGLEVTRYFRSGDNYWVEGRKVG